jgi:hypothetical protein
MLLPKIPLDKLNKRLKQREKMLNNAGGRIDAFVNYHMVVPRVRRSQFVLALGTDHICITI